GFGAFVAGESGSFKKDVEDAKLAVKIGAEPVKYLKSDNADERIFAATMLISTYRNARPGAKLEPIAAEESKLILQALAKADWQAKPNRFEPNHPFNLFARLGVTDKDGWMQPQGRPVPQEEIYKAAREWLDKNADTYRIQKFVGGQAPPPGGGPVQIQPIELRPLPPGRGTDAVPPPLPVKKD